MMTKMMKKKKMMTIMTMINRKRKKKRAFKIASLNDTKEMIKRNDSVK